MLGERMHSIEQYPPSIYPPRLADEHVWGKHAPLWWGAASLEAQVNSLGEICKQVSQRIGPISRETEIELLCAADFPTKSFHHQFDFRALKALATLNASISVDIYFEGHEGKNILVPADEGFPDIFRARLLLSSATTSTAEITRIVGAESDAHDKTSNVWIRTSRLPESEFEHVQVQALLEMVPTDEEKVQVLRDRCEITVVAEAWLREEPLKDGRNYPSWWSPDLVRRMVDLGATLEIRGHFFDDVESS